MSKNGYYVPEGLWGHAVRYTYIDENGKMWIGNGEYESQVNYCPVTGEPAPTQMRLIAKEYIDNEGITKIFKEYTNE